MAKFDIKTAKPKFVVTTAPDTKIDVSINRPIITAKNQKAYFKLKNTGGPKGEKGDPGTAATISVGSTSTGAPGTSASVTNAGTSSAAVLNFVIPKGDKGDTGETGPAGTPGAAATVTVGTTATGNPGTNASVTNSGTSSAAVLNFTIPRGAKGEQGIQGPAGDPGTPGSAATIAVGATQTSNPGTSASVVNSGTSSAAVLDFTIPRGDKGEQGNPGSAATVAVGTVTTGLPGTSATVTNVGTSSAAVFDFTIPRGDKGEAGSGSGDMLVADYDPNGTVASAGGIVDYVASEIPPLYTELGENTDGPITQKASREALYVDSGKTVVKLGAKAFSTDTYGARSTSVGAGARAGGNNSVAIGSSSSSMGTYAIAIGSSATTGTGSSSISIGYGAKTNDGTAHSNSVALGAHASATRDYEVNVGTGSSAGFGGNDDHTRVIAGVHAGVQDTDAVNVGQLNAALPTKTSDLTNDGADGTSAYVEADDLATVATSGSYNDLTDKPSVMSGLVEMSYGEANAWAKFIAAYQAGQIVYCRASSNADPSSGSQTRKAFMSYVNNAASPTQVEFQYYRSVSSHTDAQQGDQVFVYLLTSANGGTWSVTTRNAFSKVVAGTNMTSSYSNGAITLNATQPTVPTKTSDLANDGADGSSTYVEADELAPIATDGMAVLAYGTSTWQDFIDAYNENRVVYCRASTDADPSVGDKTRLAPLLYVDSESSPTSAQFHFHRSFVAHTDAQQGDQIIVYALDSTNGGTWSVATREAGTRVAAGTNMTSWYNNGVLTLSSAQPAAVNLTSSVTKASGVTINSGGSVFQIGKIVIINMDITTTASISAWGTILSGLPARTPASSVYFALVDDNNDRVLRAYLGGDGTIHTRGALSAGNYSIDLVYVTS